jgi:hypothetical protein
MQAGLMVGKTVLSQQRGNEQRREPAACCSTLISVHASSRIAVRSVLRARGTHRC